MSDATAIFLILGLIYLLDCMHLLHRNSVALTSWAGRSWKIRLAGTSFGAKSSGVFLSPLLPPLGTTFVAQPLPVSFAPEGVCSFITQSLTKGGRPPQFERAVRYDEIQRLGCEMKDVSINGELFVTCRSARVARHIVEAIRGLVKAAPENREILLAAATTGTFDIVAVRQTVEDFRAATRTLRVLCNIHWFYMFLLCPVVILTMGVLLAFLPLAIGLLVLHTVIIGEYWRVHKKLLATESYPRWEGLVKMVFCPPASIRALDLVSMDLLDLYHPLSVAAAVAGREEVARISGLMIREAQHPLPVRSETKDLEPMAEWHRKKMLAEAMAFLKKEEVDLSQAGEQPARRDDADRSYCPRCLTTYTVAEGVCADCSGIALVRWR